MQGSQDWLCRTYVIKIASRCNLNCSYCYMYNKGDNSWRSQPKVMSEETVVQLLHRIIEHYGPNPMYKFVTLSFHGG
ncbi:MAG TPA: radical SAM protein, partial [Bacteroidetes bacterium]|nr:radical SAM protein [Bacteroidota bacterium]